MKPDIGKKSGLLVLLLLGALFGCVAETEYLKNDAVDNIATREPLSSPAPELPCISLQKFRVISLKHIQQSVRKGLSRDASPNAIQQLCGLNTIEGYYIDRENKDILLFGKMDSRMPPLLLDDFIVALRCAWKKYAVNNVFTPPGCSIDPSARMLKRVAAIEKRIAAESSVANWQAFQKDYEDACVHRQKVRVMGLPFHTHFASVLVQADYDMKRIVNGSDAIDIPGVADLYSISSYAARQAVRSQETTVHRMGGLNRFWFKPTTYQFLEQQDWVILDKLEISLLTEEQYLTSDGGIRGKGRSSVAAEKVADSFTAYYSYIAQKRQIFRQLKELLRMYIVLEAMYEKDAHLEGGLQIDFFLNAYQVPKYFVSTSLLGQSRYVMETYERDVFGEAETARFLFPICGGINFEVFLRWDQFARVADVRYSGVFREMMRQRPQYQTLFWDVIIKRG